MTRGALDPQRVFALIPMKRFADAKSRLRAHVPDGARMALAVAMFERVLLAAKQCRGLTGVAVLTNGADVALLAQRADAHVLHDATLQAPALGLLIDAALPQLIALGADSVVVLMADLPYLEARDLEQMLAALANCDIALAADARGTSTNALAVRLPFEFATAFGAPDSYALHVLHAREHGLRVSEVHSAGIARDVDTHEDLPEDGAWSVAGTFSKLET
jgi:2-phospho-L-lactate guanylyltransferase